MFAGQARLTVAVKFKESLKESVSYVDVVNASGLESPVVPVSLHRRRA